MLLRMEVAIGSMDLSRRGVLSGAVLLGLGACTRRPDVDRVPGHTSLGNNAPPALWDEVGPTGWEPEDAVWRNGEKYFREVDGRAKLETSVNYLARDRFTLSDGRPAGDQVDRAEYSAQARLVYGRAYWCSFSVNVHYAAPTSWFLINQFHDVPDEGAPVLPPPFAAVLVPGTESLEIVARAAGPGRARMTEDVVYHRPVFERGRWHAFVYKLTFMPDKGGRVAIWHDGHKVTDDQVDLGFPDKIGPYFKFGVYRDPTAGRAMVEYANVELTQQSLEHRVDGPAELRLAPADS